MPNKHHGMKPFKSLGHFCNKAFDQTIRAGRFGRMFPTLPPLYTNPEILADLGAKGGPMDGGRGSNPTSSVDVGQVFFGQFVDHDITFDVTSSLENVNAPENIQNVRTPTLDLDCVYGDGPEASPYLYREGVYLLTGADGVGVGQTDAQRDQDLLRAPNGRAIIGDPRNDENRIISQIQLGMIRFHNNVAKKLSSTYHGSELFEKSRELVTEHYHWALLYDFLPTMCGRGVVWDILHRGRRFYCPFDQEAPFIPVEFSVAAYRFGHSMVPQEVQTQTGADRRALFGPILGRGFTPLADDGAVVDMHEIFTTSQGRAVQMTETLDTKLARTLLDLPFIESGPTSLATRNLERGQSFMLPSGEEVALAMGASEADITTVSDAADAASGGTLEGCTPLWFYLLMEAEKIGRDGSEPGEGFGPVGGRLVAEVMIGLMELDTRSFLASNRKWNPGMSALDNVRVETVGDMLTYTA